jgi:hypothetical protein
MAPLLLGVLLFYFFLLPTSAQASTTVVINEYLPQPSSGQSEWVEIYNSADSMVSLEGWKLKENLATSPIDLKVFSTEDSIAPQAYLVVDISSKLNNSGDHLGLYDSTGQLIDQHSYNSSTVDHSIGRSPDGAGDWVTFTSPSKGSPNPSPSLPPSPQTTGLSLSEFYPYPKSGEQEWAEIYNTNTTTVNLSGFKVDDDEGKASPYTIPEGTTIAGLGYLYVLFDAKLNNSGDVIRFLAPDGSVIESHHYTSATQGSAWAKDTAGSWKQTTTPTLGSANKITDLLGLASTPSLSPTPTVLAEATSSSEATPSSATKIKLTSEEEEDEPVSLVLAQSENKLLSWGLIGAGVLVIGGGIYYFFRKNHV